MAIQVEDFNFISEDEIDNIIFYHESQLPTGDVTISTGISDFFLPYLVYSPDGTTWYRENSTPYTSGGVAQYHITADVYPDNVYISGDVGLYYKIAGVRI